MKQYRIDFHTHSKEGSGCSPEPLREMARSAIEYGIDAFAMSNHENYLDDDFVESIRKEFPSLRFYNSIEVDCNGEHIVCIGRPDRKFFETWNRDWKTLVEHMHSIGNAVILAHPFRFKNTLGINLDEALPDAVEIHSLHTFACVYDRIIEMLKQYPLKTFGSSDAHHKINIGIYRNVFDTLPADEQEAAELICSNIAPVVEGDKARIASHNVEVDIHENAIRDFIAKGGTPEEYEKTFNRWRGYYDCIVSGKSYRI